MIESKRLRLTRTGTRARAAGISALALSWLCFLAVLACADDFRTQPSRLRSRISTPGALSSQTRPIVVDRAEWQKAKSLRGAAITIGRSKPDASLDWTYRPTVVVRRGTSQGSGTIIASINHETLVLTAAHVVRNEGPIVVELHRYNLGLERSAASTGSWPRRVRGTLAASDAAADLTVIRIEGIRALPYVARLARSAAETPPQSPATSIGIDLGTKLAGWSSRVMDTLTLELNDSQEPRSFLISDNVPEHGRSGGGLFLANGELVGVCVGHAELLEGRRMGVFASRESIQLLLEDNNLTAAIRRSDSRWVDRGHSLPGSPNQKQKEADRQKAEYRESNGLQVEEEDE
jgi:S1-C subfamily serine protease